MDDTRDEALVRTIANAWAAIGAMESALSLLLRDAPADLKEDMAKRLAAGAAEAVETAAGLYAILDGEG